MNIKKDITKDKKLFDNLMKSTFVKIEVGSKMYGLEHKNSDTDLLCIYNTSNLELNSITRSHHQIQFTIDGDDYLFINIHSFISNILSGDSTINFEVINSRKLIGTDLEFLYNSRKSFYNYKIIRSYLGLARRDLKRIDIDGKTEFGKNKKIAHAYRGLSTAIKIYEIFSSLNNNDVIYIGFSQIKEIKKTIWKLKDYKERRTYSKKLEIDINDFRKYINNKYDEGNMITYMTVKEQQILETEMMLLTSKIDKMVDFNMIDFYDANENDIKY